MCGVSGHSAVASVEAGFKPGHGPVSHLRRSRTCVRVWWRRAGPATHSPARVSSSFSVCACVHFSTHPCLSVSALLSFVVGCERVVCAKCVLTAILFIFLCVHPL